jgi:SAM-dependent methyltransferase
VSEQFDQGFWDDRYRSQPALWSGRPNRQLTVEADQLTPGNALDVGCGEGADAIWLAERGWQVTAVDISPVALERGALQAVEVSAEVADRIHWLHQDLIDWEPPARRYDLVTAQYMHLPTEPRRRLFDRLASAVVCGGTLLIVGHHPSHLQTTTHRPPMPELFFTGDDIVDQLDLNHWEIVTNAAPSRDAVDEDGGPVTFHDAVLRARRRPDPG